MGLKTQAQPDYLKLNKTPPAAPSFSEGGYIDINPVISPNGQIILFTRIGHPNNMGGVSDPGDIWCKKKRFNGTWGEAYHLGRTINNVSLNYIAGFDSNSKIIYLNNTYHNSDTSKASLSYTNYSNGFFTAPHKFELEGLQEFYASPLISAASSNNFLILSLAKSESDRRENLHISFKVDGTWTPPIRMNDEINSQEREIFPFMPNDTTLYFSSNGLAGYGGMDGYVTQRQTIDWNHTTLPYNLGPKFNSNGEETNLSISQDYELYYLYEARNNASKTIRYIKGIPLEFEIIGNIYNQKGKPLSGTIEMHDFEDYSNQIILKSNNLGRFFTKIHKRTAIKLIAHTPDHLPQIHIISTNQSENESQLTVDFSLQKIILGQTIPLPEIQFSEDGRDLLQVSLLTLEVIAEALEQNTELSAIISLNTYRSNDPQENKRIADMESKSIRKALEGKGAPMKHIILIPTATIQSNNEDISNFNTKVEIVFVKK